MRQKRRAQHHQGGGKCWGTGHCLGAKRQPGIPLATSASQGPHQASQALWGAVYLQEERAEVGWTWALHQGRWTVRPAALPTGTLSPSQHPTPRSWPKGHDTRGRGGSTGNSVTLFHVPGAVPSCCTRWQTVLSVSPSIILEKSLRGWVAIVILILNQERHVPRG